MARQMTSEEASKLGKLAVAAKRAKAAQRKLDEEEQARLAAEAEKEANRTKSPREMKEELVRELHRQVMQSELKGVALMNTVSEIRKMLPAEDEMDERERAAKREPTVAEVISGIRNLPVADKVRILKSAREELEMETMAIDSKLEQLVEQAAA